MTELSRLGCYVYGRLEHGQNRQSFNDALKGVRSSGYKVKITGYLSCFKVSKKHLAFGKKKTLNKRTEREVMRRVKITSKKASSCNRDIT
jgi:hypothetical protein